MNKLSVGKDSLMEFENDSKNEWNFILNLKNIGKIEILKLLFKKIKIIVYINIFY
jgi:hypothetical protein